MSSIKTFKTLQRDSNDRKYPRDNSVLRLNHVIYAIGLLNRVKAEEGLIIAALSAKQDPDWKERSQYAKDHPMEQVLTGFAVVEDFIIEQQERVDEGKTVKLIDGDKRHVLSQSMAGLYTHMKSWYNSGGERTDMQVRDIDDFVNDLSDVSPNIQRIVGFFS